jgi:4-amino-4-deoxy-L-arabinose transferase-like glycosyltransferase
LRQLKAEGTPFYEQPLFHAPPLFAATIWAAHRALAADAPFAVLAPDRAANSQLGWRERFAAQGYAVIVPWLAALGLVLVAAALGALLCGPAAAALSAWLLAVAPAQALCAQRVWADSLLALCVGAAALAFWQALRRDSWRWALWAGVALALALWTKNNATLAVFILGFAGFDAVRPRRRRIAYFASSCAVALVLALPWYLEAQRVFGSPWFNPQQPGIAQSHAWFAAINARPWSTYFVATAWQNPAFAVALIGSVIWLVRARGALRWLSFWCLLYVVGLSVETTRSEMLGPDERYLLPAYPAFAALSARWCVLRRGRLRALVFVALALSAAFSLWLAQRHWDADLILAPF